MREKLKKWWKSAIYIAKVMGLTFLVLAIIDQTIETQRSRSLKAGLTAHSVQLSLDRESRIIEMTDFINAICQPSGITKTKCAQSVAVFMSGRN